MPRLPLWVILTCGIVTTSSSLLAEDPAIQKRPHVTIRGIYGGVPTELLTPGPLSDRGVNAIFMGSGSVTQERIALLKKHGVKVFAEFNTMHVREFVKQHPSAAPIGVDGKPCPPPHGWQGVCPTHEGYRKFRMAAFREVLKHDVDGVWLDYHHSHASWERAEPAMPDTCFCRRCVGQFQEDTKVRLAKTDSPSQLAKQLLSKHREAWVQWRCDVFTDWVREFREIIDQTRPKAHLGTFHCPWSLADHDGALRDKLAIDLKAQAKYVDVFSIMPYHARFGHPKDPAWISRQTAWLGNHLGIRGDAGERLKIWPIVQLSDWGESVDVEQVEAVLDHGTRKPATGVMAFHWGALRKQPAKVDEMLKHYRRIQP